MNLEIEIAHHTYQASSANTAGNMLACNYHTGAANALDRLRVQQTQNNKTDYPQSQEDNEYRYIDANWLDMVAAGLTKGVKNHPGETWRSIPADEHAARAMRHLNLHRAGDVSDDHLINASMRIMMAYVVDRDVVNTTQTKLGDNHD